MKKQLDLRGLSCPEPVLKTKKALDDQSVECVEVLVDDEVNVQNLERLARSQNLFWQKEALADHFKIIIDRQEISQSPSTVSTTTDGEAGLTTKSRGGGTVVFIAKDTFGQGASADDHDFSHNLINVFLQTIQQSGLKPRAILLANSGVKLIDPDASTYKVLADLKDDGVTVLACGLCLDYYKLKDKVPVEQITNMFAICEYMFAADQLISP